MSPRYRAPFARFRRCVNAAGRAAAVLLLAAAALGLPAPLQAAPAPAAPPLAPQGCDPVATVKNTLNTGTDSLRAAVGAVCAGGTVVFLPGLAGQTIQLTTGEIIVDHIMTIDGSAAPGVAVDAGNLSRVFNITASDTVTLTGLVLAHGHTNGNGGALLASQKLVLQQVHVLTSTASGQGGGLYASATASLSGTQFISNTSGASAGGAWVSSDAVVSGGSFERNMCTGLGCQGGGLNVSGLTVTDTQFIDNASQGNGGGAYADSAAVLTVGEFQDNQCSEADCQGGGLDTNATLTVSGTEFYGNNSSDNGGGAYANGAVVMLNGLFEHNQCHNGGCQGGGLYANGTLTATDTLLLYNSSQNKGGGAASAAAAWVAGGLFQQNQCSFSHCQGGGFSTDDALTLTGTQFISNTSFGDGPGAVSGLKGAVLTNGLFQGNGCSNTGCQGGGLRTSGPLVLTGTQFIGNTSVDDGGGVYAEGAANLTNGRFERNQCTHAACQGGGLYANEGGTVASSSFSGNHAAGSGGALAVSSAGSLALANVTLAVNTATVSGGALFVATFGRLNLDNVTVAGNQAADGGGLLAQANASLSIGNSIFANNSVKNCSGPAAHGTHNLEWPGSDCAGPSAGFTSADPQLLPLALNPPGSTLTQALGPLSPARDHGDPLTCATAPVNNHDQRGVARPLNSDLVAGAICDIGAYEASAPLWQLFLPLARR